MSANWFDRAVASLLVAAMAVFAGFRVVAPPPCATEARIVLGVYEITCPSNACTGSGLCDFDNNQVGGVFYHFCACDDTGAHPKCQGMMLSTSSDPEAGGYDVVCFDDPDPCEAGEICDETQLTGAWQTLCTCK